MTRPETHVPRRPLLDEESLARLIAEAGPPPPAPEIEVARIREAVRAQWRYRYGGRVAQRWRWRMAAAAALTALVSAGLWLHATRRGAAVVAPELAAVARVDGEARVAGTPGGDERRLAAGERLAAGAVVRAATGRVALRWHDGRSLRLDEGTELVLLEAHRIELRRGALYLDSAEALAGGGPEIATIHGRFRAIGTQFEVRLDRAPESGVRLRVRRGAVELRAGKLRDAVAAGAELHLGADGRARRAAVATHGAAWAWVLEAAPVPDVDGWTLARFLAWYGRESGLEIAYADAASAALATEVVLHGATARLRPAEALAAAAASAGFETRAEGGRLVAVSSSAAP